jgi:ferredoxin
VTLADLTPVDWFIAQQRELTPVERFSAAHSAGTVVAPERRYEDRIPAARPQPGQQYAFSVDLDACTGCKACVAACRSLNGLDDDESWRSVGLLRGVAPTAWTLRASPVARRRRTRRIPPPAWSSTSTTRASAAATAP